MMKEWRRRLACWALLTSVLLFSACTTDLSKPTPILLNPDGEIEVGEMSPQKHPYPEVEFPFPVGEIIESDVYWGALLVGKSRATTRWIWDVLGERWLLSIKFRTKSNHVISTIYPVDDEIESVVDPKSLRPLTFKKNLNEGKRHSNEFTVFDWQKMEATWTRSRLKNGEKKRSEKTYAIKENTRDLVSFMYFMRGQELKPNSTYEFQVMADEKMYDLVVETQDIEEINLPRYGKVKSLRITPKAAFEGIFVRKGEMTLWVSRDARRIMTKMDVDTPFANVHVKMNRITGPGDDFWIENGKEAD